MNMKIFTPFKFNIIKHVNSILVLSFFLILYQQPLISYEKIEEVHEDSLLYKRLYKSILDNTEFFCTYSKIKRYYEKPFLEGNFSFTDFGNLRLNIIKRDLEYPMKIDMISVPILDSIYKFYEFEWSPNTYYHEYPVDPKDSLLFSLTVRFGEYDSVRQVVKTVRHEHDRYRNSPWKDFNDLINLGIVAMNIKTEEWFYISGYMFLHDIKNEFFKDSFDKERIVEYITLKYHNYTPKEIVITEIAEDKGFIINFLSSVLTKEFIVKIVLKDNVFYEELSI